MTHARFSRIVRHAWPGETRAALLDTDGQPCRLFMERWAGQGEPARFGSQHGAHVRRIDDTLGGAFIELESGEQAFVRLKDRRAYAEGASLNVQIVSEARRDKLARAAIIDPVETQQDGFALWMKQIEGGNALAIDDDPETVAFAFDEALAPSLTLPGGGQVHIDRARALWAFDIDSAGRTGKGSAAARALSLNRDAIKAIARQVELRAAGGLLIVDCVSPITQEARELLRHAAQSAFVEYGATGAKVLKPSPLGLLEASLPWRVCPIEDRLQADPGATELSDLLRNAQREAASLPTGLFALSLSKIARSAYLEHRTATDAALEAHFGGRVVVKPQPSAQSTVEKR